MAFVEQRLLDCVAYGTQGGPTFLTRKVGLRSGKKRKNPMRANPLYRFAIIYNKLEEADHADVIAAFNACYGGVHSFRLKDWADYRADGEPVAVGTGAEQIIQLSKRYEFGALARVRPIRKPVVGTVTLTSNGAPQAGVVDYTTGLVTFTAPVGQQVRWFGEFDVPVSFEDDALSFQFEDRGANGFFLTADISLEEDTDA